MCSLIAIRDAVMNRMDDFWKSLQEAVSKVTDTVSFCINPTFTFYSRFSC